MRSRIRRIRRSLQIAAAIAISLLVGVPDAVFAATSKSMDQMSPQELDHFVQGLNESANWRKFRRPTDPPDFVPGKPVRVMHGAGSSMGRGSRSGASFRRSGLANRRSANSSRRNGRGDAMAQDRGSSRSSRSGLGSSSSGFGSSSRSRNSSSSFGNSSRSSFGSGSSFGNSNFGNGGSFDQ